MKIVFLWTDVVVLLVLASALLYAWKVTRTPHLAETWRKAFASPSGAAAATVLALFVAIGLVDSLHYRALLASAPGNAEAYAPETRSLLDALLAHQAEGKERSYSAPLAYVAHEKEAITEGGDTRRVYPRLLNAGRHLQDPGRDWAADVALRAVAGAAAGLVAVVLVALAVVAIAARRRRQPAGQLWHGIATGRGRCPWRTVLATLTVLFVLTGILFSLAREYHVFGTDRVGNDLFYVVLKSIRTALVIGTMSTLVTMPIAVGLGVVAGYLRGWVDEAIQYVYTVINSIPYVLLIASVVLILMIFIDNHSDVFQTAAERTDARLFFLCVILGMTSWTDLCRLLRGEVIKLREAEYIQAAQAFGVSTWRILGVHLLPNVMHLVLISMVINFSGLVLAEAVLSYVGVGVDPSMQSFGTLINTARLELSREPTIWWTLATAFTFMFTLVLSANLFADAIRDAFDPRAIHR
ncbi:MAG: ABC transporter permease [Betaproteobacteria bacterium]